MLQGSIAPQEEGKTVTGGIAFARDRREHRRTPQSEGPVMAGVKPIPDGYPRLNPYLIVDGAAKAIEFYQAVFGARERSRLGAPGGKIGHAELEIGDSLIMIADEFPSMDAFGPAKFGGSPIGLHIYVADVDAVASKAVAAGGKLVRPVQNQFYGDRSGTIEDPFGHRWHVATHVEDVTEDEIARRAAELAKGRGE
jgi:PhnB protein